MKLINFRQKFPSYSNYDVKFTCPKIPYSKFLTDWYDRTAIIVVAVVVLPDMPPHTVVSAAH